MIPSLSNATLLQRQYNIYVCYNLFTQSLFDEQLDCLQNFATTINTLIDMLAYTSSQPHGLPPSLADTPCSGIMQSDDFLCPLQRFTKVVYSGMKVPYLPHLGQYQICHC